MTLTRLSTLVVAALMTALIGAEAHAQQTVLVVPVQGGAVSASAREATTRSIVRRLQARGFQPSLVEDAQATAGGDVEALGALAREREAAFVVVPTLEDFAGSISLRIRVVNPEGTVVGEDASLVEEATIPQQAAGVLADALSMVPSLGGGEGGLDSPFDSGAEAPAPPARAERPAAPRSPHRRSRRRQEWPDRHFWLGGQVEPGMGTNRSSFDLSLGIRSEFGWRGLIAALNFGYLYIKDWEPRSNPDYHTLGVYGMVGYQIPLGTSRLTLPLLAGGGYIPGNGGLFRFEAGLSIRPIDRLQIRVIFVCPNFWFLDGDMVLFTSLSIALLAGF